MKVRDSSEESTKIFGQSTTLYYRGGRAFSLEISEKNAIFIFAAGCLLLAATGVGLVSGRAGSPMQAGIRNP